MKIPAGSTSYCPPLTPLTPGDYRGRMIRHTVRLQGTQDWLLIYTRAGSGWYRFANGTEYRSRSGNVTLYRPGAFHNYQFSPEVGKWDLLWAHFQPRPEWLPWLDWPEFAPGFMVLNLQASALRRKISLRMKDVVRLNAGSQSRAQSLALNALEEVLLRCDAVNPRQAQARHDDRVGRAMDFLREHLAEPFSEEQVARAAGLSASRLRHLFTAQAGVSPRDYLERQRMLRARDLLAMSRHTIGEIAIQLGFSNPFYFTLRFKKHVGESPRGFRQQMIRT